MKFLLAVAVLILAACSSSKITSSWKAPDFSAKKYNKILVLGLIHDKDRSICEQMESHLVGDLQDKGYQAVSAMKEYGPKAFEGLDEKGALEKIKENGADAVLTIVLLNKEKETKYIPGQWNVSNRFWGYYGYRYRRIYEPGYYVTDTQYFWETNFYDLGNQDLLYSAQTKSFSPSSTEALGHEYGRLIVKNFDK